MEIHEVEERKNEHVNQLMRNHQRDFRKMKEFYNGITKKNVETINNLKVRHFGFDGWTRCRQSRHPTILVPSAMTTPIVFAEPN